MNTRELLYALPAKVSPSAIEGQETVFHFDIEGDRGGQYTISVANGSVKVEDGLLGDPRCVIRSSDENFINLVTGELNPMMAVLTGKVKISNQSEMLKYAKIFWIDVKMDIETFRKYCLSLPAVEETLPFGPDTLVYKVVDKVFALTGLENEVFQVNLKCDPERAIELREEYDGLIIPGWHMNKKHWNTVYFEEGLSNELLFGLINHSYNLVIAGLPVKIKAQLKELDE